MRSVVNFSGGSNLPHVGIYTDDVTWVVVSGPGSTCADAFDDCKHPVVSSHDNYGDAVASFNVHSPL